MVLIDIYIYLYIYISIYIYIYIYIYHISYIIFIPDLVVFMVFIKWSRIPWCPGCSLVFFSGAQEAQEAQPENFAHGTRQEEAEPW